MSELTMDLCWMQILTGGSEVLRSSIPVNEALAALGAAQREVAAGMYGAGAVVFLRPSGERDAAAEIDKLNTYIARLEQDRQYSTDRFSQQQIALDNAAIRIGELAQQLEHLRSASQPAATLLQALDQRGGLGLDVHRDIAETLAPLDAALAATKVGPDAAL